MNSTNVEVFSGAIPVLVQWEEFQKDPERLLLAGGVDDEGIIRHIAIDSYGRVIWAPDVERITEERDRALFAARGLLRHARLHGCSCPNPLEPDDIKWLTNDNDA